MPSAAPEIFWKYTALADWNAGHAITGEYLCPVIEGMTRDAVDAVRSCCTGLAEGDENAFEQLTYGLILSGLAMQLMGNSRPASGSEHHVSHLIEMQPAAFPFHSDALHGEKVGVGTILISRACHKLAEIEDITPYVHPYSMIPASQLEPFYGPALYPSIVEENKKDCMEGVTPEMLIKAWPEIRRIISTIPAPEELSALYEKIGAKKHWRISKFPPNISPSFLNFLPAPATALL